MIRVRIPSPPPSLYDKALIFQGFVVSGFGQNLPAHTSAHTLDEVLFFRPAVSFSNGPIAYTCIPEKQAQGVVFAENAGTNVEIATSPRRSPTNYTQTKTPLGADCVKT